MRVRSAAEEKSARWFSSAKSALKSISGTGAAASNSALLTRVNLARLCHAYEERYRTTQGVPLTASAAIIEAVVV